MMTITTLLIILAIAFLIYHAAKIAPLRPTVRLTIQLAVIAIAIIVLAMKGLR